MKFSIIALLLATILSGCLTNHSARMYEAPAVEFGAQSVSPHDTSDVQSDRMLVWTGSIRLEVESLTNAQSRVTALTKSVGGFVESSSKHNRTYGAPSIALTIRIPSASLKEILGDLEGFGEVKEMNLSSDDVTEHYIDTQARLATKKKLRDRLEQLLNKAEEVKDIMAIEKELNRLQADIDSMTARLKSMKGKVDYASLTVKLEAQEQKQVLGPLGYVWEGTKWCVTKLFVWKEAAYLEQ